MGSQISFNPILTTNATGSFNIQSEGYIQGTAMDDPSARYRLRSGYVDPESNVSFFGGMGISEDIPIPGPNVNPHGPANVLQSKLVLATSIQGSSAPAAGQLTGFTVFDQAHNLVQTPQSQVPLGAAGMTINYYPLGSLARIAVACDPILADLQGDIVTSRVSWDFVNQLLVPYEASGLTISSGTYDDTTGEVVLTFSTGPGFGPPDAIVVSSLTGTGTNLAELNGNWTVTAADQTAHTATYMAPAGLGAITITGGSATEGSGTTSILPVRLLDLNIGNSMTVEYDPDTGFANWNRNGSCALIQI